MDGSRKGLAAMVKNAIIEHQKNANVIKLSGDFCYDTVGPVYSFINDVLKQDRKGLIFDLSGVEFIDSKGAGFFLDVKRCVDCYRQVILADVPPEILAVLDRLMIAEQFKVCRKVEDALIKIREGVQ